MTIRVVDKQAIAHQIRSKLSVPGQSLRSPLSKWWHLGDSRAASGPLSR